MWICGGKIFPAEKITSAKALRQEGIARSVEGPTERQLELVESWQVARSDVRVTRN